MTAQLNRRRFERFALSPMYTEVKVQRINDGRMAELAGYAYDISEGGLRVELDQRLQTGEHVNVTLSFPGAADGDDAVQLACEAVWVNDELDDPIMPRMALRIMKYLGDSSHSRLLQFIGSGVARAA